MSVTSIGAIGLDVKLQSDDMTKQASNVASKAESTLTGGFRKIGGIISSVLAVTALAKFGSSCIQLGSDLNEVQNVVDVTFPSMSAKVNEFATNAATKYGLSETMAKKYMGTLGSMSEAFGFSESASKDMAEQLTGLSGDIASFYNISQDEAYTKLKSVFTGETESLKDLGVVMTQTALDQYALQNGFGKTTDEMSEQEKVSLRLAFVTDQLTNASGDFQRTSNGWANQIRILSLNFQTFKATIGQGLINALSPAIKVINFLMAKLNQLGKYFLAFTKLMGWGGGASSSTADVSNNIASASSGASGLNDAISGVSNGAKNTAGNLTKAAAATKEMKAQLAGFDTLNKLTSSDTGTSGDDSGSGSGSGSGGSGSGGAEIGDLGTEDLSLDADSVDTSDVEGKVQAFIDFWKKQFNGLKDFVQSNADAITSIIAGMVAGFAAFEIVKNWSSIVSIFTQVGGAITTLKTGFSVFFAGISEGSGLMTSFSAVFGTVLGPAILIGAAVAAVTAALVYLYQTSDSFNTAVNTALQSLMDILTNLWASVIQPLFSLLSDVFVTVLVPIGELLINVFIKAVQVLSEILLAIWNNVLAPIANFLVDVLAIALQGIIEIWNAWKPAIEIVMGALNDIWNNVLSPFVDFIKNIVIKQIESFGYTVKIIIDSVKEIFQGLIDFVVGIFTGNMDKAWGAITKIFQGFADFLNGIFTTDWSQAFGGFGVILNGFLSTIKSIWNMIRNVFDGIIKFVTGVFSGNWSKAWQGVKDIFSSIVSGIGYIFKSPINAIIDGINSFIRGINKIKIPDWVPAVGGRGFNIGTIPRLAKGGYVGADNPQLAIVGDNKTQGEIVSPEDKLQEMANRAAEMASNGNYGTAAVTDVLYEILDTLKNLGIDEDTDRIIKIIDKRRKQRSIVTGKLITE
jgi:phage-related protein